MKIAKKTCLFVFGFLAALALSGCINPISTALPGSEPAAGSEPGARPDTTIAAPQPFTVTISIGADGRAAAGAGVAFIKDGLIRNYMQLIVVDKTSGTVHTKTQSRQTDSGHDNAVLEVQSISYGKPYEFLLLMGHWERDYAKETTPGNGTYLYTAGPPTLLAAGLKEATITSNNDKVTITMWPIVVDTVFTTGGTTKDAVVGETSLAPGDWNLEWTVLKGASAGNGFEQLIAAQQAVGGGNTLEYEKLTTIVRGTGGTIPDPQIAGNKITQNIGDYTKTAGDTGSANFKLEYVPFGNQAIWGGHDKPVWIIRNGVNDLAQNTNTTFADSAVWEGTTDGTKNGNGAVAFKVDPVVAVPPATISEDNLLEVLEVFDVAAAIEELHKRIRSGNMDGLKLGMYLDLPSLTPDGENEIELKDQNLRIVIASFNQYKATNPKDHIKFVFKNIPVKKKMRSDPYNYGGYPYTSGSYGTPELKEYLEGAFFTGLKTALGHDDYFYEVTRNITGGNKTVGWTTESFTAAIFIDTEMEVFGTNTYNTSETEKDLTQTALYGAPGGAEWQKKKYDGSSSVWWGASPNSRSTNYFTVVNKNGGSTNDLAHNTYGVAPAFCIY